MSALSYFSTTASGTLSIAGLEIVDSLFKRPTVYIDDWSSILESSINDVYFNDPI